MNIQFDEQVKWTPALEGVAIWMTVDGKRVGCVMEGRVLAKHFGVENRAWKLEEAFLVHREFLQEIIRDAIARGMVNEHNHLLLGKRELMPYLEKATAPA